MLIGNAHAEQLDNPPCLHAYSYPQCKAYAEASNATPAGFSLASLMETIQEKEHVQNVSHRRHSKPDEDTDSETGDVGMPSNGDVAADDTFGSNKVRQLRPHQDRFREPGGLHA